MIGVKYGKCGCDLCSPASTTSKHVMIDVESLGNNNDSQLLSIGACLFDGKGAILRTFYRVIDLEENTHVKATPSTLAFWVDQGPGLLELLNDRDRKPEFEVLYDLAAWISEIGNTVELWANGGKFDISTLESLYKSYDSPIPWEYNADRCMRTLRFFAGKLDIDYEGRPHHALDDAVWQAKYVAAACERLGLTL